MFYIGLGFNGAETSCGTVHVHIYFRHPTGEQLRRLDFYFLDFQIFRATAICRLLSLNSMLLLTWIMHVSYLYDARGSKIINFLHESDEASVNTCTVHEFVPFVLG